jgi:hypothetical protein
MRGAHRKVLLTGATPSRAAVSSDHKDVKSELPDTDSSEQNVDASIVHLNAVTPPDCGLNEDQGSSARVDLTPDELFWASRTPGSISGF